jgi:hypothetical protein
VLVENFANCVAFLPSTLCVNKVITLKNRSHFPDADGSFAAILPESQLEEKEWQAGKNVRNEIRHQKSTSAISVAQVRESPYGSQAHCVRKAAQDELQLIGPVATFDALCAFVVGPVI